MSASSALKTSLKTHQHQPLSQQERSKGVRKGQNVDPWSNPSPTSVMQTTDLQYGYDSSHQRAFVSSSIEHCSGMNSRALVKQQNSFQKINMEKRRTASKKGVLVPGVSKMSMRQTLSLVFSAFWDRADLYRDVLEIDNDQATTRQLKLAFFRQGRLVLATPIESSDDMTFLSAGMRGVMNEMGIFSGAASTASVVQAGVPISRKAKLKFQAIALAYELLEDNSKRKAYDEWRTWNSRLPPPPLQSKPHFNNFLETLKETELESTQNEETMIEGGQSEITDVEPNDGNLKNCANLTSILLNPNAHKRWQRKKRSQPRNTSRKITWNEDVEEITFNLPQYHSFVEFKENEKPLVDVNSSNDPYGMSAEGWFGSVDSGVGAYDWERNSSQNKRVNGPKTADEKARSLLFAEEPDMGFGKPYFSQKDEMNNVHSLKSKTIMVEDTKAGVVFEGYNPNDSLMMILDGEETDCNDNSTSSRSSYDDSSWQRSIDSFSKQYEGFIPKTENKGSSRSTKKHGITSNSSIPSLPRNPQPSFETDDGDSYESHGNSYLSYDNTASIVSNPVTESQQHDHCGISQTVDLALGFKATLSNYINSAVSDMKEGLQIVGEDCPKWEDMNFGSKTKTDNNQKKNFFFLDQSELDAMMSILKEEMYNLAGPMLGANDSYIEGESFLTAETSFTRSTVRTDETSVTRNTQTTSEVLAQSFGDAAKVAPSPKKTGKKRRIFGKLFSKK